MQKSGEKEIRQQALSIMARILLLFTVGSFIFSPCFQLILRFISRNDPGASLVRNDIRVYQDMIQKVNWIALFTAVLCYGYYIVQLVKNRSTLLTSVKKNIGRTVPLLLLWLLAIVIPLVTVIRGPNEYDLTGHPYMYESIFSYMLYPTCYFFCGAMLWQSSSKRILLYLLLFSALPVNAVALIGEWVTPITFFHGKGVSAVFHNSNHYGYYLVLVVICSAILFVYEKAAGWKIFNAASALIGSIMLIINDSFGSYLAVFCVLTAFAVYCFLKDKDYRLYAMTVLAGFLLLTLIMSFYYHTVVSSITQFFSDVNAIAADPLEYNDMPNSTGTARWKIWNKVIKNIDESPLLGFGVEGLLNTHHIGTPHNEILQYTEFFGIPAALIYLSAVVTVIVTVLRHSTSFSKMTLVCFCAMVGYFTGSMFGVAVYYTTPFFYIFLGLTYAEYMHGKNEQA